MLSAPSTTGSSLAPQPDGSSEGGITKGPCECPSEIVAPPLTSDEVPVEAEVVHIDWNSQGVVPLCTEKLACLRWPSVDHRPLDATHIERYWKRYKSVRAASRLPKCPADVRIAIVFTSNTGAKRWIATGSGVPYMETEDRVCHPLDRDLFRDVITLLGIQPEVAKDPDAAKYL